MSSDTEPAPNPTWMSVLGWIISILPGLGLIASGSLKLANIKPEGAPDMGWSDSAMFGLGIVEIGCAVLYLLPPTATLGAILLTGYLGGAVATHVRIGDPPIVIPIPSFPIPIPTYVIPIVVGMLAWFGLLLRDARVRSVLPWRGDPTVPPTGGFLAACGKILLTLVVLVGVVAALIAALPAEYSISRSITIDAPPSKVFEHVNDFNKWAAWSPWLKLDPSAKMTIEGAPGKDSTYQWSGNDQVGEGKMTLVESRPNELVKIKLEFIKPMPGIADTNFDFKEKDNKTIVTWSMSGEHDFVGKAMWLVFSPMVGASYEEGLANIKSVVESKK